MLNDRRINCVYLFQSIIHDKNIHHDSTEQKMLAYSSSIAISVYN